PHSREYFQDLLTSLQLEPNLGRTSTSYETVRSLVAHGHGWSILNQKPRLDVTYDGKELVALPVLDPVETLDVVLAWHADIRLTRRADAFIQFAKTFFD